MSRQIPAINVEDAGLRRILQALKEAVEANERDITAVRALATTQRTTVIQRAVAATPTPAPSTGTGAGTDITDDELVMAPYPPPDPVDATTSVTTGMVVVWPAATSSIPDGWLLCDGASKATADYAALFSVIGYTWGGAGANFNLPDFSDRYLQGVSADEALGAYFGATDHEIDLEHTHEEGTLAATSNGAHTHGGATGTPSAATANLSTVAGTVPAGTSTHTHSISSDGAHTHTIDGVSATNVYTDGSVTDPVDIRPQSAAVYWIIKT